MSKSKRELELLELSEKHGHVSRLYRIMAAEQGVIDKIESAPERLEQRRRELEGLATRVRELERELEQRGASDNVVRIR